MTRILITGNAGSGKTTLARQIGDQLSLPVTNLDCIVWGPNWQPTPRAERDKLECQLVERPCWVIDGVSFLIQERADMIVFLDLPRWLSYWRCTRRNIRYLFRSRPGLPEKCPEIKIVPTLIRIIWRFPQRVKPKILALGQKHSRRQQFVQIKSLAQIDELLRCLEQQHDKRLQTDAAKPRR